MKNRIATFSGLIFATGLLFANTGYAFDMGNVMNPSKWMGGNSNRDRYDDYDRGYGGLYLLEKLGERHAGPCPARNAQ